MHSFNAIRVVLALFLTCVLGAAIYPYPLDGQPEAAAPPPRPYSGVLENVAQNIVQKRGPASPAATPAPTGMASPDTTVYINDEHDFSLLGPNKQGELVSDAENDGVSFCTPNASGSQCTRRFPGNFIQAATVLSAADGSWIQVTGCIDPSKVGSPFEPDDDGGQFDVRFPNGAQCSFGGYGASFIELVEPSARRFCLRCCKSEGDQINCNSHQDKMGCPVAVPGVYDFPEVGVSCS